MSSKFETKIVGGPDRFTLFAKYGDGEKIRFTTESGFVDVRVHTIQREDGSGQSFNLIGHIDGQSMAVGVYYSTKNHVGVVKQDWMTGN